MSLHSLNVCQQRGFAAALKPQSRSPRQESPNTPAQQNFSTSLGQMACSPSAPSVHSLRKAASFAKTDDRQLDIFATQCQV